MTSVMFLKVAYVVAWVVYIGYLARILVRMKTVAAERAELERTSAKNAAASQSNP
ncbi:MAG TPA: hypothetical protein VFB04_15765 [Terriglobales bacterium]|nr:hypothetical protein [Terriglobales bacterium]